MYFYFCIVVDSVGSIEYCTCWWLDDFRKAHTRGRWQKETKKVVLSQAHSLLLWWLQRKVRNYQPSFVLRQLGVKKTLLALSKSICCLLFSQRENDWPSLSNSLYHCLLQKGLRRWFDGAWNERSFVTSLLFLEQRRESTILARHSLSVPWHCVPVAGGNKKIPKQLWLLLLHNF